MVIGQYHSGGSNMTLFPVCADDSEFIVKWLAVTNGIFQSGYDPVVIVGVNIGLPLLDRRRGNVRIDTVELAHTCVPGHLAGDQVVLPDTDARRLSRQLDSLVTDVDLGLCEFVFGDVEVRADHAQRLTLIVPFNDTSGVMNPDPVTVFVSHPGFAFIAIQFAFPVLRQKFT